MEPYGLGQRLQPWDLSPGRWWPSWPSPAQPNRPNNRPTADQPPPQVVTLEEPFKAGEDGRDPRLGALQLAIHKQVGLRV